MAHKTKKFALKINALDTLVAEFEINQSQFNKRLAELIQQHERSKDAEEGCFRTEYEVESEDFDKFTRQTHIFKMTTTYIVLRKTECKPGYHFTK